MVQQHKVTYGVPMDPATLVKEICDIKQFYTQYGGARPFGVSLMFAGIDDEPVLFVTDPTGIFFQFKATAIGEYESEIKQHLAKEYKETLTIEEATKLTFGILKKVMGKEFDVRRIDGVYIKTNERKFKKIDKKKLKV
jgi:proteasome alpha subunit